MNLPRVVVLVLTAIVRVGQAQTWVQLTPPAPLPSGRYQFANGYNPATDRYIVFGGYYTNDVWVLSNATGSNPQWIQLIPNGATGSPGARTGVTGAYDPTSNRMTIYGGIDGSGFIYNDVWVLTHADGTGGLPTWTQLQPTTMPPSRFGMGSAYDASTNRMIVFMGATSGSITADSNVYVLTNANGTEASPSVWSQLSVTGTAPPGRVVNPIDSSYDPASNRLIIFGGTAGKPNDRTTFNDTWVLTNANGIGGTPTWIALSPSGLLPSPRGASSGFYDSSTNRLVIYGGTNDPGDFPTLGDTWVLTGANGFATQSTWLQLSTLGSIPSRRFHQASYNKLQNKMIIFGGQLVASTNPINETWVLDTANGLTGSQLQIDTITPNRGGNAGMVTIQLLGTGFIGGASIKLTGVGSDIISRNTVVLDAGVATAAFDLTGAAPGVRSVVITNPDNTTASLTSEFTVELGGAPQISVNIIGRNQIRIGGEQQFYLTYINQGTVDASDQVVSLLIPSPLITQPLDGLLLDEYQTPHGTILSYDVPTVSAGGTSFVGVPLSAPASASGTLTLRGQLTSGTAISALQASASLATPSISTPTPPSLGGLLFGPEPFDSCSQPINTCSACSAEWSKYQGYFNLAQNAENAFAASQEAFLLEGLLVGAEIAQDVGIASGISAVVATLGVGLVAEGILTQSEAATLGTYMGALAQYVVDAERAGPNNPAGVLTAAGNGTAAILQANAIAAKITNSRNIIKSQALQATADSFLYSLGLITTALTTLSQNAGTLKSAWDERNTARGNYLNADMNMCSAVNAYLQCASSKCGSGKTMPTPGYGDDLDFLLQTVTSLDPSVKIGPPGVGSSAYITGYAPVGYSVYFDNQASATAPAQVIRVTDALDPNLDPSTLTLGGLSFPNQVITPPAVPLFAAPFTTTVDLRPTTNLQVSVSASLNPATRVLTVTFQSLDSATNQPPADPLAGFLPPGAEGSVFLTVLPKSGVPTGTIIQNTATVVFDNNPPINTPTWFNTIDNTAPRSRNSLLPAQSGSLFTVQWSGTDVGSGIASFTIYVSDNGDAFTPWLTQTTAASGVFNGQVGHTYGFYSIAQDLVGNNEPGKTQAEATTQVTQASAVPGNEISVTASGLAYSRVSQTFNGTVTIQNVSSNQIYGPFEVLCTALTAGVTLANASGALNGTQYVAVPNAASLAPGQNATVAVQFKDPSNASIKFTPVVYSGGLN